MSLLLISAKNRKILKNINLEESFDNLLKDYKYCDNKENKSIKIIVDKNDIINNDIINNDSDIESDSTFYDSENDK